jgi:hypothetical protein
MVAGGQKDLTLVARDCSGSKSWGSRLKDSAFPESIDLHMSLRKLDTRLITTVILNQDSC